MTRPPRGAAFAGAAIGRHSPLAGLARLASVSFVLMLVAVSFVDGASQSAPPRVTAAAARSLAPLERRTAGGATFDLYGSYPNYRRLERGYFLRGTNRYRPTTSVGPDRTSLWFEPQSGGSFKQFATTPYRKCHWDLLRWGPGKPGLLVYLGTRAACFSAHTDIVFHPGIAYMPRTWRAGEPWIDRGVSGTTYSEDGAPVCSGTNVWTSRVIGLTKMAAGGRAVHTQTDETQTLSPIPGAPGSSACPPGRATTFEWQENFYLDDPLEVRAADASVTGFDVGLARSVGGNMAALRAAGHPQWDSIFSRWEPLPPADAGSLTASPADVPNASMGNTIVFTYTGPAAGLQDGVLRIAVPPGWTPPVTLDAGGCTVASAGAVTTSGQAILVSGLTLPANGQVVVTYGATSSDPCAAGDGAAAPSASGAPVWQGEVEGIARGTSTSLTTTPSIDVDAADGSGALTLSGTSVGVGSSGNTLRFAYTASTGGTSNGTVTIAVPPGWTPPVTTDAAGCTVATTGNVTTSGQTIVVSGLSLAANTSALVTYGATSGGSCSSRDGVTPPVVPGTSIFTADEMSTPAGTLSPIGASPAVGVG